MQNIEKLLQKTYKPPQVLKGIPKKSKAFIQFPSTAKQFKYPNFSVRRSMKSYRPLKAGTHRSQTTHKVESSPKIFKTGINFFPLKPQPSIDENKEGLLERYEELYGISHKYRDDNFSSRRSSYLENDIPIEDWSPGDNVVAPRQCKLELQESLTNKMFGQRKGKKPLRTMIMNALLVKLFKFKRNKSIQRALFSQRLERCEISKF